MNINIGAIDVLGLLGAMGDVVKEFAEQLVKAVIDREEDMRLNVIESGSTVIIELRVAREDMGWFFEQWVYGTDVPTYAFSWTAEPAGEQWRIKLRIEQRDVPGTFRMPVFVRLDFGDAGWSRQRVWVTGKVTEVELPLSPRKPTDLHFNDLESVLCEVAK